MRPLTNILSNRVAMIALSLALLAALLVAAAATVGVR
jgi:hypothetical protein